jgi:hypothetical protein
MQTPRDVATMFNEYFHSVYTNFSGQSSSPRPDSSPPLSSISSIDLSLEEVYLALQNLDLFRAHGPDGFPSHVLKECAFQLAPSLHVCVEIGGLGHVQRSRLLLTMLSREMGR